MSKGSLSSLQESGEKLDARWAREYAGKPRHTRDLDALDAMIEKADGVVRKARNLTGPGADALRQSAAERLQLFQSERAAIAEAKFDRPQLGQVHDLGRAADAAYANWRRHFAGQDRRTRDLGLLDGMIEQIAASHAGLTAIHATQPELVKLEGLHDMKTQLELLKDERNEIAKAKKATTGRDKVVCALDEAQQCLDRYRVHYAGQPRVTADADQLARVVARLDGLLAILESAPAADKADLGDNIRIVREQREVYANEIGLIRTAHASAPIADASGQLGHAANLLFQVWQEKFAGQSRATRDLKVLSELCDRLHDIHRQMKKLAITHNDATAIKNEQIVEERVRVYETEWIEISKAKTEAATKAASAAIGLAPTEPPSLDSLIRIRKD